jgi:transcriptional regulator with XRE-family HTH domain
MSSALPTPSTGHSIALGALNCSPSLAGQRHLAEQTVALREVPCTALPVRSPAAAPEAPQTPVGRASDLQVPPAPVPVAASAGPSPASRAVRATTPKHRVAKIREQQGVSQRTLARRLGIDVKTLQALERPESDLSLSQLLAFQSALEVPLIDLLEDHSELSRPIAERAKMVKVMKTAAALREVKANPRVARMAQMLCEQLVDVMPELAEVSGWPQFGSRRGPSALGKALSQPIDTSDLRIPD